MPTTYTRPITAVLNNTGLATSLAYKVLSADNTTVLVARVTPGGGSGITEDGSSRIYSAAVPNWDVTWSGWIVWDAGSGTLAREEFRATMVPANVIQYAGQPAADHDGTCRAGSSTAAINLDATDSIANALPNATANQALRIVRGTGVGQVIPIASLTGSSGSRVANVAGGFTPSPVPDNTSDYLWETAATSGSGGATAGQIATAVWQDVVSSSDFTATGSAGKLLRDNLDAAVSTRLATSGYTAPSATVTLAASQPNYAPARAGDAMTLTTAYDPVKTSAQAGTLSALVSTVGVNGAGLTALAPASTALSTAVWTNTRAGYIDTAISGVTTGGISAGTIATAVWTNLLTSSDFAASGSVGKFLKDTVGAAVTLAATQPNYAPAKPGDSMSLMSTALNTVMIEPNYNAKQVLKVIFAAVGSTITGNGTTAVTVGGGAMPAPGVGSSTVLTATMTGVAIDQATNKPTAVDRTAINAVTLSTT